MTALKFYTDDGLHEWNRLQHYHSTVPVVLRCGVTNLIPFCYDYETTAEDIDDVIVEYLDGAELTLDDIGDFSVETDGILDWIIYNGEDVQSGAADLDAGLARLRIEMDGGSTFWSDYFEICPLDVTYDCGKERYDNYFNLYFSADHDLTDPYNIVYQTGYENHHAFDTLPVRPDSVINVEGETDEAQDEAITYQSQRKIYHVEILGGQSLFDMLSILPAHEYVYVSWPCVDLREARNIEFGYEWVEDFLCRMTISFSVDVLEKPNCGSDGFSYMDLDIETVESEAFMMEVTTMGTVGRDFTLPTDGVSAYDYIINWGDGTIEHITANTSQTHSYPGCDNYTIRITGTFPQIKFSDGGDKNKVLRVLNLGDVGWDDFGDAFWGCGNLTSVGGSGNLSNVANFLYAFRNCTSLVSVNSIDWDISSATDLRGMFWGCSSLITIDTSNWDLSSVTQASRMFMSCSSLTTLDVSGWDVSDVTSLRLMFFGCNALTTLDVSSWDTSSVTDLYGVFNDCNALTVLDVSGWDASSVVGSVANLFDGCNNVSTLDVSGWDTSGMTSMSGMFQNCSSLTTLDVSGWDLSLIHI